jgi:hypothetical protein
MLFGRPKKERVENVAAAANLPKPPQHQTVINHAPSEVGKIFAKWIVCVLSAIILWYFLLYLVEEMGYRDPVRVMGWVLVGTAGLIILTAAIYFGGTRLLLIIRDTVIQVVEINANARVESARHNALTAGAPALPAKRLTAEQMRFFENLALVMQQAYQDLADSKGVGYQGGSDKRPWSKRSVLAMDPPRYGKMPDSKAADIRTWLAEHGVIIGNPQNDQINTELYPTFADFQTLLKEEFDMSIVVRTNKALPSSTGGGYVYTGFE